MWFSWGVSYRRTRTPTWHSRKCLGRRRDPICGCTRSPSLCWMMQRWRRCCRRAWQDTAAPLRLHELRGSVLYLPDHPSVWATLNCQCILLHTCSVFFMLNLSHSDSFNITGICKICSDVCSSCSFNLQ